MERENEETVQSSAANVPRQREEPEPTLEELRRRRKEAEAHCKEAEALMEEERRRRKEAEALSEEARRRRKEAEATLEVELALSEEARRRRKEAEATLEEERRRRKEAEAERSSKSLEGVCTFYPFLENRTISSAHCPKTHKHAKIIECSGDDTDCEKAFDQLLQSELLPDFLKNFWDTTFSIEAVEKLDPSCDSEFGAQMRVVELVKCIIIGLGLNDVISVVYERSLAGIKFDLLLVYKPTGLPFAPIEVTKPNYTDGVFRGKWNDDSKEPVLEETDWAAGKVFDQCHAVQLIGFESVYGMLTDFNHWRLSCTKEIHPINEAEVASLAEFYASKKESKQQSSPSPPPTIGLFEELTEELAEITSEKALKRHRIEESTHDCCLEEDRTLHCTEVVPKLESQDVSKEGKKIVSFVALFVLRAFLSVRNHLKHTGAKVIAVNKSRPCRILSNANKDVSAFGSVTLEKLKPLQFPSSDVKELYVVRPLGYGTYGECCLAAARDGSVCVVKFFRLYKDFDPIQVCVQRELSNWQKVYNGKENFPKCFTMDGPDGPYLVMPFLEPVPAERRKELLDDGKIKDALESFASSGFIQNSVQWRHFGWWGNDLLMFDLDFVTEESDPSEVQAWIDHSLSHLSKRIGTGG